MAAKTVRKRVGRYTVRITKGTRDDVVGIGDRFEAEVEGHVTALATRVGTLYVGTSKGIVARLETVTGRRCARATFKEPIRKLAVRGAVVTVFTKAARSAVNATTLRPVPTR